MMAITTNSSIRVKPRFLLFTTGEVLILRLVSYADITNSAPVTRTVTTGLYRFSHAGATVLFAAQGDQRHPTGHKACSRPHRPSGAQRGAIATE